MANEPKLGVGDRAPDFSLPDIKGTGRNLYNEVRGLPIVLVFLEAGDRPNQIAEFSALNRSLLEICDVHLYGVFTESEETLAAAATGEDKDLPLLADPRGMITQAYAERTGRSGRFAQVLDPNQRIIAAPDGDDLWAALEDAVREIPPPREARLIGAGAPVLILPNLIDRAFCTRLINAWTNGPHDAGFIHRNSGDEAGNVIDSEMKRRTDHYIDDQALKSDLSRTLGTRLFDEVSKSFFFPGFSFAPFRIGRYDAKDRGFFDAHRDNVEGSYQNRRYAMSLNLNAEDHEGGDLRFPEYGPELYRAPTGGGVVFSCSLMHEVVPVTAGERFVLLTFLLAL